MKLERELISAKIFFEHTENKFIFLYSGLISNAQQVDILVDVAIWLRDHMITDVIILIVGDGPEKNAIIKSVQINRLENLLVLHAQPRNTMPDIITAVDVCIVLLSQNPIFEIAIPNKFYEYLSCGKPIVGMCRGELKKIITEHNLGMIVRYGNK